MGQILMIIQEDFFFRFPDPFFSQISISREEIFEYSHIWDEIDVETSEWIHFHLIFQTAPSATE